MATTFTADGDGLFTCDTLGSSQSTEALESLNGGLLAGCVHVVVGGGSGFNSGTVTIQASLDKTNWFTAKDVTGTDMTLTAAGYFEFSLGARAVRVTNDASVNDVDVAFFLT